MKPSVALSRHARQVLEAIARYPVRNPRVFGSTARGDDVEASDLDILVEPEAHATFYDLAALELELEAILGCKVDVLTPGGLAPHVAERARTDLKPIQ